MKTQDKHNIINIIYRGGIYVIIGYRSALIFACEIDDDFKTNNIRISNEASIPIPVAGVDLFQTTTSY